MSQPIPMEEYQRLKNVDIRTVDPDTVPDIRAVRIDPSLPPAERIRDVARQMNGNPFVYRCGGLLVKTSFRRHPAPPGGAGGLSGAFYLTAAEKISLYI